MNREDIIRMAREAWYLNGENVPSWHELERFAALVSAAEREACAKAAEDHLTRSRSPLGRSVASAIRARSNTE